MMTMIQLFSCFYVADLDEYGDGHNDDGDADDKDDDHAIDLSDDDDDTTETDCNGDDDDCKTKKADVTTVLTACADLAFVSRDLPLLLHPNPAFLEVKTISVQLQFHFRLRQSVLSPIDGTKYTFAKNDLSHLTDRPFANVILNSLSVEIVYAKFVLYVAFTHIQIELCK